MLRMVCLFRFSRSFINFALVGDSVAVTNFISCCWHWNAVSFTLVWTSNTASYIRAYVCMYASANVFNSSKCKYISTYFRAYTDLNKTNVNACFLNVCVVLLVSWEYVYDWYYTQIQSNTRNEYPEWLRNAPNVKGLFGAWVNYLMSSGCRSSTTWF